MRAWAILCLLVTVACSSPKPPGPLPWLGAQDPTPFGGARPVKLYVPKNYSDAKPAPLLIFLHGYGASGYLEDYYLGLTAGAEAHGMLYAYPDGTLNSAAFRYWNATDACCDIEGTHVDDSKYISDLIAEVAARYKVDPKRVYLAGHSNGAFMSYRMACDHADLIAGLMSLAGETWLDTSKCAPSAPVAVLQVQGTLDDVIWFAGGVNSATGHAYPGALATATTWAAYNGCSSTAITGAPPLDLERVLPGAETTISRYPTACRANGQVELWAILGGSHIPDFGPAFVPAMLDWLMAHPKP